jgi:hypothetical protein
VDEAMLREGGAKLAACTAGKVAGGAGAAWAKLWAK